MEAHPPPHLATTSSTARSRLLEARRVPVFLFMGEDECRALDERVRAFLTSGVTGDEDYVIIDTAEYAIPGLDDDFRVIVSPWILSVLTTDRLARKLRAVSTKHNLQSTAATTNQLDY